MRVNVKVLVIVLGVAVAAVGCGSAPKAEIEAARAAVEQATTAGAGDYATESMKAVQDAQAALEAELQAQQGKWFGSYAKAKELAAATKAAGEKAAADAAAGKEKARADAAAAIEEARTLLGEAQQLLEKAPKGKGTAADIAAMQGDLTTASTAITDAATALDAGRFVDALAKAESATAAATTVKSAVEAAMAARKK
jgi:hypothetical protein